MFTVHFTLCSSQVMYAFQNEPELYSCMNVKELLARNRHDTFNLNNCNGTRTQNNSVRKRTLNHLLKFAK